MTWSGPRPRVLWQLAAFALQRSPAQATKLVSGPGVSRRLQPEWARIELVKRRSRTSVLPGRGRALNGDQRRQVTTVRQQVRALID